MSQISRDRQRFGLPCQPQGSKLSAIAVLAVAVVLAAPDRSSAGDAVPLKMSVGQSRLVDFPFPLERVSIGNTEIADVAVVSPAQVVVTAKAQGSTTLMTWIDEEAALYDVIVEPDLSALRFALKAIAPDDDIEAGFTGDSILLRGSVSNAFIVQQAEQLANGYSDKVVNLLSGPANEIRQVQLQVHIAEVSRQALHELGFDIFLTDTDVSGHTINTGTAISGTLGPNDAGVINATTALLQSPPATGFFAVSGASRAVAAGIDALESTGDVQVLAEPTLIVISGSKGNFLAGGEFPLPQVDGTTGDVTSYIFKEFGVALEFAPEILESGKIRLAVTPSVSDLDFANGIVISGIQIPLFRTRRVETAVELDSGDSLIIGGLINHLSNEELRAVPVLGDIPVLGVLFRSSRFRNEESELVVIITPTYVRPFPPGEFPTLPTDMAYAEDEIPLDFALSNPEAANPPSDAGTRPTQAPSIQVSDSSADTADDGQVDSALAPSDFDGGDAPSGFDD